MKILTQILEEAGVPQENRVGLIEKLRPFFVGVPPLEVVEKAQRLVQLDFQPGIHRHYKDHRYMATGSALHHDTRMPAIIYTSLTTGAQCYRPFFTPGEDSWFDLVKPEYETTAPVVRRFERLSDEDQPK